MTLQEITEILASEIECSIFEQHVQPALEAARKMLEEAAHDAQSEYAPRALDSGAILKKAEMHGLPLNQNIIKFARAIEQAVNKGAGND